MLLGTPKQVKLHKGHQRKQNYNIAREDPQKTARRDQLHIQYLHIADYATLMASRTTALKSPRRSTQQGRNVAAGRLVLCQVETEMG
jgi:hypothetical protein